MLTEADIKCFMDLTKTLNYTRTAENLYMTQQSVSRRIAGLEESLGVQLFERTHRYVVLTPEGERMAILFSWFESEFSEYLAETLRLCRFRKKRLIVGYQSWIEFHRIPAKAHAMACIRDSSFSLEGELHSPSTLLKLLSSGCVDLIMLFERFAKNAQRFIRLPIREVPTVLLVPEEFVRSEQLLDVGRFASCPFIVDRAEQEYMHYEPECGSLQRFGLHPDKILVEPNIDSVLLSVELGKGIALGTTMSQVENRFVTKVPTGVNDNIICLWRDDGTALLAEMFAQCLKQVFDESELPTG